MGRFDLDRQGSGQAGGGTPANPFPGHTAQSAAAPTAAAPVAPVRQPVPPVPAAPTPPSVPTQPVAPAAQAAPAVPGPRPIPTSVVFETVEPDRTKRRVLLAVGAVVLSVAMAGAGYVVGHKTAKPGSAKADPTASPTVAADPKSPNGFMGTALTGGQQLPGGRQIVGQDSKMNFMLPQDWQVQVDAKAPNEVRYAVSPYACVGHGSGACTRGLVVQNLRVFNGGWSDPKSLVLGMGQLLYNTRYGADAPPRRSRSSSRPSRSRAWTATSRCGTSRCPAPPPRRTATAASSRSPRRPGPPPSPCSRSASTRRRRLPAGADGPDRELRQDHTLTLAPPAGPPSRGACGPWRARPRPRAEIARPRPVC